MGLFGAALAGSCSWPDQQHVVLASSREKKSHFIVKAAPTMDLAEVHSVPGMEGDCRVTPEQGMPTGTEQRSQQSRAPHRTGKQELLPESSQGCPLSPRSWQHRAGTERRHKRPFQVIFLPLQMPTESFGSAAAIPSTEHTVDSQSPNQQH